MAGRPRRTFLLALLIAAVGCTSQVDPAGADPTPRVAADASSVVDHMPVVVTMGPLPSVTAVHPGRVPRGAPPRVPYVERSDIVFPDGRRTVLQRPPPQSASDVSGEAYASVARMRAGWLAVTYDFNQLVTTVHGMDGTFRRLLPASGGGAVVAVTRDHRRALLAGHRHGAVVTSGASSMSMKVLDALPQAPMTDEVPVGFARPDGGRVVVNLSRSGTGRALGVAVTSAGQARRVPGVARARATSPRAGLISGTHFRGFSAKAATVYSLDGTPHLRAPGLELVGFSPDGTLAVGVPHRWNPRRVVVVSVATGEVLLHLDLRAGHLTWEDRATFLVVVARVVRGGLSQGVLRISVDGAMEWALEPRIVPFLAGRPFHGGPEPVLVAD